MSPWGLTPMSILLCATPTSIFIIEPKILSIDGVVIIMTLTGR